MGLLVPDGLIQAHRRKAVFDLLVLFFSKSGLLRRHGRQTCGVLRPGGAVLAGDVAFETRRELELCRAHAAEEWDSEENYPVAEELRRFFPALEFERISFCAGILRLSPPAGMLDIDSLFSGYDARVLRECDIPEAAGICSGNPEYYGYMRSLPSTEALLRDTLAVPEGKGLVDKYFLLIRDEAGPLGLADIISGYPEGATAWIGLFMLRRSAQGKGVGRKMASQLLSGLKAAGFRRAGLAYVKDNPVPSHFWPGIGFEPSRETVLSEYTLITAFKTL